MKIIKKYPLPYLGVNLVGTFSEPRWLSVEYQDDNLVAWCEDDDEGTERCWTKLWCVFTGWLVPPMEGRIYLGTAQSKYGIVCHVYEVGRGYFANED